MGKRIRAGGPPGRLGKALSGEGEDETTRGSDAGRAASSRWCGAQRLFG